MSSPVAPQFDAGETADFLQVMQETLKAIEGVQAMSWAHEDALRPLSPRLIPQKGEFLQSLEKAKGACRKVSHRFMRLVDTWVRAHDAAALHELASTPAHEAQLRQRIAHANQSLQTLYPQLLALCQQVAARLQQEWQSPSPQNPLHDGHVHVELHYELDGADVQYVDDQDNLLTKQVVLDWSTGPQGCSDFDPEAQSDRIHDNWLDHPHPWMDQQCWLAHDLLEHSYGSNPRMGVAALSRTGRVYVDVHSVRSYEYDLCNAVFVPRRK